MTTWGKVSVIQSPSTCEEFLRIEKRTKTPWKGEQEDRNEQFSKKKIQELFILTLKRKQIRPLLKYNFSPMK